MTTTHADLLIVDDHLLLAQGLALSLVARGLGQPMVVDPSGCDAFAAIEEIRPDLVLLDIDFGDNSRAGVDLIARLVAIGCRVVMFTGINDDALYGRCIDLGAETVIRKSTHLDAVVDQIERAVRGEEIGDNAQKFNWYRAFRVQQTERSIELAPFEALTGRESKVLAALLDGFTVEEIAENSFVAVCTVRSQVRSIFSKLGVHSQVAAVALARRANWQPSTMV